MNYPSTASPANTLPGISGVVSDAEACELERRCHEFRVQIPGDGRYFTTKSGNRIDSSSSLLKPNNMQLSGRVWFEAIVARADLALVRVGKMSFVGRGTVVRPSLVADTSAATTFAPCVIGENTAIGRHCVVRGTVGSYVEIGDRVVVEDRSVVKDGVVLLDDSVVPEGAVLAPFGVYAGNPARRIAELPEATTLLAKERRDQSYKNVVEESSAAAKASASVAA